MRTGCNWWKTFLLRCGQFMLICKQCNTRNLLRVKQKLSLILRDPWSTSKGTSCNDFPVWVMDIVMTILSYHLDYIWNSLKTQAAGYICGGFFLTGSFEVGGHTSRHPIKDKEEGSFCFWPAWPHSYWQVYISCWWGIPLLAFQPTSGFQHILKTSWDIELCGLNDC